jgi:TolB protein
MLAATPPAALAGKTELVSVSSTGVQADGKNSHPAVSGNGAVVAFESGATNLVAGDTNGTRDVYVCDRTTGRTVRASVSSSGEGTDGFSSDPRLTGKTVLASARANGGFARKGGTGSLPSISLNGRWVAFDSDAATLVSGDNNRTADIVVRKLPAPSVP